MNDWRKAVHRNPISFSVTNTTLRLQTHFVTVVSICGIIVLFVLYALVPHTRVELHGHNNPHAKGLDDEHGHKHAQAHERLEVICKPVDVPSYNTRYPLTLPQILADDKVRYRIAVIADLDTRSKITNEEHVWNSWLLRGFLTYYPNENVVQVKWDKRNTSLRSSFSLDGRGMELSELVVFNGYLLTCDDRTGIVYKINERDEMIPWVILTDGDGDSPKGFKCEWMAVKDKQLYVGGLGKEWTSISGELLNYNPQWVKRIDINGHVEHLNWRDNYNLLRSACGIQYPGYVIHESAAWSHVNRQWIFLPRRTSASRYNEIEDEKKGSNILLTSNDGFVDVRMKTIGPVIPTHGFSSFKLLPNTNDRIIVAIKSEEDNGNTASYITAFDIDDGKILMSEQLIGKVKYEGIEFI